MTEFDRLLARLDSKLEEFKTEFKEGQEKVAAAAARKARQEPRYTFKKKAHEEQSKVNDRVDETMQQAEADLQPGSSGGTPNIDAALESLKQGRKMRDKS